MKKAGLPGLRVLVGHLSRPLPLLSTSALTAKWSVPPPFAFASPHEGRGISVPALGRRNYQQFTLNQWLLVLLSFGTFIFYWNQYTMHYTLWDWIPDLRDAAIPFVTGGFELLLNHTIPSSLSLWLFAEAALVALGATTTWHTVLRAGKEAENIIPIMPGVETKYCHQTAWYSISCQMLASSSWVESTK